MLSKNITTGEVQITKYHIPNEFVPEYQKSILEQALKNGKPENIPEKLYHITLLKHFSNIQKQGIVPGVDGCVYLCDGKNLEKMKEKMALYYGKEFLIVLEIDKGKIKEEKLYNNTDGINTGFMYFEKIKKFRKYK